MKRQIAFLSVFIMYIMIGNAFAQTVYATKSGEKYHNENCRYVNKGSYSIELSEAIEKGLSACSVCNPPSDAESTTSQSLKKSTEDYNQVYDTNQKNTGLKVQCSAMTKAGKRC